MNSSRYPVTANPICKWGKNPIPVAEDFGQDLEVVEHDCSVTMCLGLKSRSKLTFNVFILYAPKEFFQKLITISYGLSIKLTVGMLLVVSYNCICDIGENYIILEILVKDNWWENSKF